MILCEYRGRNDGKYLFCTSIEDLKLCIAWLEKQMRWMQENDKTATTVMDFKEEEED
jgi:hypothetical protein